MVEIKRCGGVRAQDILDRRRQAQPAGVEDTVRGILEDVRLRGDAAVLDYTGKFDF